MKKKCELLGILEVNTFKSEGIKKAKNLANICYNMYFVCAVELTFCSEFSKIHISTYELQHVLE